MTSHFKQQETLAANREHSKQAEREFLKDSGIVTSDHFMTYAVMMQTLDAERMELERQVLGLRLSNQSLRHQLNAQGVTVQ